jgi:xylulokinase
MSDELVLCLDVGLTHAKAVIFRPDGSIAARASQPYPTHRPAPDWVEQDPEDWWTALRQGVRAVAAAEPNGVERLAGLAVTGQMHALVCLDRHRRLIGRAIVLGDRRAAREAEELTSELGEAWVHHTTGATLDASMPAPELRWLRRNQPDRFERSGSFLGCKDALRARLTGQLATEPIDACATALYDIRAGRWSDELLEAVGVGPERLPDVVSPTDLAGPLTREAAAELGLRAGLPVAVGAGDDVEVLGGGLLEPGVALEHLGTTGSMLSVVDAPIQDEARSLELYPHVVPGLWVVGGSMTAAGAAVGWAAELLGYRDIDEAVGALSEGQPSSSPMFLPGLAGERCPVRDPFARGAWLGIDLQAHRQAFMGSVLAGVGVALGQILAAIEALAGPQREVVASSTGKALDTEWLRLRAATYARPIVTLATEEPTALGLFTVAAAGLGIWPDVASAVRAVVRRGSVVTPDAPSRSEAMAQVRAARRGSQALAPLWPSLSGPSS